mgnify:CR=1 FL=1
MKKVQLTIKDSTVIAQDTVEMILHNKYVSQVAQPGQFLHISVGYQTLRRPISIATVDQQHETVTIIFKILGGGTKQLATYQPGITLDALGPNGNGFDVNLDEGSTVLLIGGGVGVPPLHFLGQTLAKKNINIISVLGFQTEQSVFYEKDFNQFSDQTYIVTNDGSYGKTGFVTDVLDDIEQFDYYYTCGPLPMLKAVTNQLKNKKGYISLEERMGCGVGACYACVIPTNEEGGYKKICQDGPVFRAQEVIL